MSSLTSPVFSFIVLKLPYSTFKLPYGLMLVLSLILNSLLSSFFTATPYELYDDFALKISSTTRYFLCISLLAA